MDGDIKRRNVSRAKRPTQKSATLNRRAVISTHSKSKKNTKKNKPKNRFNSFEPPKITSKIHRTHTHERNIALLIVGLVLFGLSTFVLGYSIDHDRNISLEQEETKAANTGDLPRCEVVWQRTVQSNLPVFELIFDRELEKSFKTLFIVEENGTDTRTIVKPIDGKYSLQNSDIWEYNITVIQDSDVATKDILCEYGPVLIGYGLPNTGTLNP